MTSRPGKGALALCCALAASMLASVLPSVTDAQPRELVVTFGGDVNFARSRTNPEPEKLRKFATYPLAHSTEAIAGEFDGDVNFVNVETVVGPRNGTPLSKTFVFRSHPEQFRHLRDLGVNAFGLANNHAYDHGWPGLRDTLDHFETEARQRNILHAGVGRGEAGFQPHIREINGLRVALGAIGIGNGGYALRDDSARPGMVTLFAPGHYTRVLAAMKTAEADLKILSIHYGTENMTALNPGQRAMFRRAVDEAGVHLVLGHHPHVPRAVETGPDHAIFYSLGNFIFIGGADRRHLPVGHDYGLFGKAYFSITPEGARLSALEVLPLRNTELAPHPMTPARTRATLAHLSRLSRQSVGASGLTIAPLSDSATRGAVCYGAPYGPRTSDLCCQLEHRVECDLPDLM
ncbi:CapA family protein [uncultured Roseovarius sp.]|uniref:CapA family protein n=1 Tax=uncultured Roseovarius sp. TaxID=293344 RepID=UPI002622CD41|nr:CapA family protein [uncultured Roseovarius sp.]